MKQSEVWLIPITDWKDRYDIAPWMIKIEPFSLEMFKYIENDDPMKAKQLAKGIDQRMDENMAQLFINQFNGRKIS
jgi:peptide subunit release factor RF-3